VIVLTATPDAKASGSFGLTMVEQRSESSRQCQPRPRAAEDAACSEFQAARNDLTKQIGRAGGKSHAQPRLAVGLR